MGDKIEELSALRTELDDIDSQIRSLKKARNALVEKITKIEDDLNGEDVHEVIEDLSVWEKADYPWSKNVRAVLVDVFKLEAFRPFQLSAINMVLSGKDCLVIMSTGGGKSLCYQLPAVLSKGVTIVVSPLISLIEDQIIQLKKLGINAVTMNQNSTKEEIKYINDSLANEKSDLRLFYVTPEKLARSKRIMSKLEKCTEMGLLKLIAIDEVHCCSQWGHDFRTDYQFLNVLRRQFKGVPILGLTATATSSVLDDVKSILGIQGATTFKSTFNRENLFYDVRRKPATTAEMVEEIVRTINEEFSGQSGIIYCFSRKECEELCSELRKRKIRAGFYHAYADRRYRQQVHENWLSGKYQVIVATVAFGMGIDKPDVRFVIHHSIAKSVENYYQESGRAGRDGKPARCIVYYRITDVFRQSTMVCTEKTGVQNLYSMLSYAVAAQKCRRILLADHFAEVWDSTWCNRMCDNCSRLRTANQAKTHDDGVRSEDFFPVLEAVQEIIENQKDSSDSGRTTGNKLLDLLSRHKKCKTHPRHKLEDVVAHFLLDGYLQEDFHFTPYAIISYVVVTSKAKRLITSGSGNEMASKLKRKPDESGDQRNDKAVSDGKRHKTCEVIEIT